MNWRTPTVFPNETTVSYTTRTLERMRFAVMQYVSRELADEFANPFTARILENTMFDAVVVLIRTDILGENLDRKTVRYPDGWRNACKEALYEWLGTGWDGNGHWPWLGDYARKHWPTQYRVVDIDIMALYPKMAIPREGKLHINRMERTNG